MKKISLVLFAVFILLIVFALSQPRVRHMISVAAVSLPEFAIAQSLRGAILNRQFEKAVPWLEKHFEIVKWYGEKNNRLVPGLVNNIRLVYAGAVLPEERELFISILEKAIEYNPKNIDLIIMLSSALTAKDSKKSLEYLEMAANILPSDQRIYHIANIIMKDANDNKLEEYWCKKYLNTQFGDYEGKSNASLLGGGYRRISFEYDASDKRNLVLNEGMTLNNTLKYEFILEGKRTINNPSFRFSTGGGLEVDIKSVTLFASSKRVKKYSNKELRLYPETGYLINNKVISTNRHGENIFIRFHKKIDSKVDKVTLEAFIRKLPLNNTLNCNK